MPPELARDYRGIPSSPEAIKRDFPKPLDIWTDGDDAIALWGRELPGRGRLKEYVGYFDADGYLFLCDRKRDMVISGGVNIYPAEIEAALHTIPCVADCAVFGIPDAEYGEALMAGMPGGGRRRPHPRSQEAELLRWAAVACYAAALPLAAFGLVRSQVVWFAAGIAILAGFWCQRTAALAARLEEQDEEQVKADVPGD